MYDQSMLQLLVVTRENQGLDFGGLKSNVPSNFFSAPVLVVVHNRREVVNGRGVGILTIFNDIKLYSLHFDHYSGTVIIQHKGGC